MIVSAVGLKLLLALAPADLPRLDEIRINTVVLAFALLLSAGPACYSAFSGAESCAARPVVLKGGRMASAHGSMPLMLVAAQYAIALVLLTGSGLLVRSLLALQAVTPGFDPHHLLTFTVDLPDGGRCESGLFLTAPSKPSTDFPASVRYAVERHISQSHSKWCDYVEGQAPNVRSRIIRWVESQS